jgi:hypothetical protein
MLKTKIKALIKNPDFLLLLVFLINLPIFGLLNRPIGKVWDLYSPIDDLIPFVPAFILIYHLWFPFLLANAFAFYKFNRVEYRKLMAHFILGQWASYFTFLVFQTVVTRPSQLGSGFFNWAVSFTYNIDNNYAGFPSVHALTTMVLIMSVLRSKHKPGYKVFAILFCCLILASILLVKQHVFWDLPGGIVYALVLYPVMLWALKRVFPNYQTFDLEKVS